MWTFGVWFGLVALGACDAVHPDLEGVQRCEGARSLILDNIEMVTSHFEEAEAASSIVLDECAGERKNADGQYVVGVRGYVRGDIEWVCAVTFDPATQYFSFRVLDCVK